MNEHVIRALMKMELREMDADIRSDAQTRNLIFGQIRNFPSFVLPDEKSPLVICGFVKCLNVVTAWMLAAKNFERDIRKILPMQRHLCASIYAALSPFRMEIEIDESFEAGRRYAQALGFDYETTLKRAGTAGQDLKVFLWPHNERKAHDY